MGKKQGQATVEFILMISVLVPIIVGTITQINKRVFQRMNDFLQTEVVAEVRYGYSKNGYFKDKFNSSNATATSGDAPVMYGPDANTDSKHPLARIKAGWL